MYQSPTEQESKQDNSDSEEKIPGAETLSNSIRLCGQAVRDYGAEHVIPLIAEALSKHSGFQGSTGVTPGAVSTTGDSVTETFWQRIGKIVFEYLGVGFQIDENFFRFIEKKLKDEHGLQFNSLRNQLDSFREALGNINDVDVLSQLKLNRFDSLVYQKVFGFVTAVPFYTSLESDDSRNKVVTFLDKVAEHKNIQVVLSALNTEKKDNSSESGYTDFVNTLKQKDNNILVLCIAIFFVFAWVMVKTMQKIDSQPADKLSEILLKIVVMSLFCSSMWPLMNIMSNTGNSRIWSTETFREIGDALEKSAQRTLSDTKDDMIVVEPNDVEAPVSSLSDDEFEEQENTEEKKQMETSSELAVLTTRRGFFAGLMSAGRTPFLSTSKREQRPPAPTIASNGPDHEFNADYSSPDGADYTTSSPVNKSRKFQDYKDDEPKTPTIEVTPPSSPKSDSEQFKHSPGK